MAATNYYSALGRWSMAFVKVGCPHCGNTIERDATACDRCGKDPKAPAFDTTTSELTLMQSMTDSQRLLFQTQLNGIRKTSSTGVLLAIFLGGIGAHHFYLGNNVIGVLYLLFCWTFIPVIIALFEAFAMPGRVAAHNLHQAKRIAAEIRTLSAA